MKKIITLIAISGLFSSLCAQDLHFSQFFTNQIWLNPALTGQIQNDYSVAGLYRNQWNAIDARFENMAFSGDAKIPLGNNYIGVGGSLLKDNLPDAKFTVNTAMLSGAYHYYLDYTKRHLLSAGLNLGWTAKTFAPGTDLEFGNQYQDYKFDASLANNENLTRRTINSLTINAGLAYKFRLSAQLKLKSGINFNSLSTPNESFVSSKNSNQLGVRYISYVMADYELNSKIVISPKILYTNQSRGEDINFGALATYKINSCTYVQAGGFYRLKDAGIFMLGFGYQSVLLRASVDLTTSSLKSVKNIQDGGYNSPRAYEIGIIYSGLFKKHDHINLTVPCGIF
jgi:type IX secretion system PorP/SprF family membrane protein